MSSKKYYERFSDAQFKRNDRNCVITMLYHIESSPMSHNAAYKHKLNTCHTRQHKKTQTQPHALWEKLKIHVLLVCFVLFSTPDAFFNVENIRRTNRLLIIKHIISEHNINRWRKQIRYLNVWTKQQPFSRQLAFEQIMTNSRIFLSFLFS